MRKAADTAAGIVAQLPSVFGFEAADRRQMVWLWNRAVSRGASPRTSFPPRCPPPSGPRRARSRWPSSTRTTAAGEVKRWRPSSFAPLLKITQPGRIGAAESWRTLMVIEAFPLDGLQFPGSEFFTIADRVEGFDIDWALRIHKRSRRQAIAANNKNSNWLAEQLGERDSGSASPPTPCSLSVTCSTNTPACWRATTMRSGRNLSDLRRRRHQPAGL